MKWAWLSGDRLVLDTAIVRVIGGSVALKEFGEMPAICITSDRALVAAASRAGPTLHMAANSTNMVRGASTFVVVDGRWCASLATRQEHCATFDPVTGAITATFICKNCGSCGKSLVRDIRILGGLAGMSMATFMCGQCQAQIPVPLVFN